LDTWFDGNLAMVSLFRLDERMLTLGARAITLFTRIVTLPMALALLAPVDVPLYFVVMATLGYVGLVEIGQTAFNHTKTASAAKDENLSSVYFLYRNARKEVWYKVLLASQVLWCAYLVKLWIWPGASILAFVAVIQVCLLSLPSRAVIGFAYGMKKESAAFIAEMLNSVLLFILFLTLRGFGVQPLPILLICGSGFICQIVTYGLLERRLFAKASFDKSSIRSVATTDINPRINAGLRLRYFSSSLVESLILYGDSLIAGLLFTSVLVGQVGFVMTALVQMLGVANVFIIRVWTHAAEDPKLGLLEVLRCSNLGQALALILGLSVLFMLFAPQFCEVWTLGAVSLSSASGVAGGILLILYSATTALSFYMKGTGLIMERNLIMVGAVLGRVILVSILFYLPHDMVTAAYWFGGLCIVTLIFDLFPSLYVVKTKRSF